MIVLSEDVASREDSASARDTRAATEVARLLGFRVYYFSADFEVFGSAEDALDHLPVQDHETPAVWVGYIPSPARYQAIYHAAKQKKIFLLNSPEEHLSVMAFDQAYPRLLGLTPESLVLTDASQCEQAFSALGAPLFVKGSIQSLKHKGIQACVANSLEELRELVNKLLASTSHSRGKAIVRTLVTLRHSRTSALGFPLGREFRVFLYRREILAFGYYWEGDDPLKALSAFDEQQLRALAIQAAGRFSAPYLAVDLGQREDGRWIVIETGDPQFSGASQIPLLVFWSKLKEVLEQTSV